MKKSRRLLSLVLGTCLVFSAAGCGNTASPSESAVSKAEQVTSTAPKSEDTSSETASSKEAPSDQEAADRVAALIDAIYVQEWNEKTDSQCAEAKAAWDALTDAQKELVEGEDADPDYFGLDTGDASLDDPLNGDDIGKKEILVVSFGTSYNDSRVLDIKGIEDALTAAFPDWSVRRAFTAQIIINHVQARDGEKIDNMDQALERAVKAQVETLVIQPTHLMHGAEYDELKAAADAYAGKIPNILIAEPLLGAVGRDVTAINEDKKAVATALVEASVEDAGSRSLSEAEEDGTAFVFMGHGTSHTAKVSYSQMQTQMGQLGFKNVFIGTVEGEPEETACENVIEAVADAGYKNVILRPLMVVAGDHANNDMAGEDEDSWVSQFRASGKFDQVSTQIVGLGRIEEIKKLYIAHTRAVMPTALSDGTYSADFKTDGSMFHVNEAHHGKGILTVEDGAMTIHISLPSKNTVNLFLGSAEAAKAEGASLLEPTVDTVTYEDGYTEEVNGFDIPVPALDVEFDCALVGTKGKWYDHKVSVSNPVRLLEDGQYTMEVTMTGGSGKASIASPAEVTVANGDYTATVVWSSPHYETMTVGGVVYEKTNAEGNSAFVIPITPDADLEVSAVTTAMSEPHEIAYVLHFDSSTLKAGA